MGMFRVFVIALLTSSLVVSACGRKGSPSTPGETQEQKADS